LTEKVPEKPYDWVELDLNGDWYQSLVADQAGFDQLASLLQQWAGISLPSNDKNKTLLAGRLSKVLKSRELNSYAEYLDLLVRPESQRLRDEFVSALTTHTTEFFRESSHFETFAKLLKDADRAAPVAQGRELRIWCAAASTGQEPYSILMTILENLPRPESWDIRILATDINRRVLERAAAGVYLDSEFRSVPPTIRPKYFVREASESGQALFRIKPELSARIRWAPLNLVDTPYPFQHPFDFIFCRNVLIYFDKETVNRVVDHMTRSLRVGGALFLGHSESGAGRGSALRPISHAVYRRKGSGDV